MIIDCQNWRRTVEGVGIDELHRKIDPFDVRTFNSLVEPQAVLKSWKQYPERQIVFNYWPLWFHKVRTVAPHSLFSNMDRRFLD